MKTKPTYTATFDDNGAVIYLSRPQGNLTGELPLGAQPNVFGEESDPWNGAKGVAASGRAFTIRRDDALQPIPAPVRPVGSVANAGAGKEAQGDNINAHAAAVATWVDATTDYTPKPVFRVTARGAKSKGVFLHAVEDNSGMDAVSRSRLMAAAPALLAACRDVLETEGLANVHSAKMLQDAIAKATESEGT